MGNNKKEQWRKLIEEEEKKKTEPESEPRADRTVPEPSKGRVANAKLVNIRQEPSPNAAIIATATEGTVFEILGQVPNYFKIQFVDDNKETPAYIDARYFSVNVRAGG